MSNRITEATINHESPAFAKHLLGAALLKNDCLRTPKYITDALGSFDLDPCAGEHTNIGKVNLWDGRGENGLTAEWSGFVWCNPPFSQKEIWAEKMINHGNGILILPERGSAPWFGPLAEKAGCYFVMGKKINFEGGSSSNNLGSILFPFGEIAVQRIKNSGLPGHFVRVDWFRQRCT
jgi:hypothetical protein